MNQSTLSKSDRKIASNMVHASVADFAISLSRFERHATDALGVCRLAHQMEGCSTARTSILKPLANKIADIIGERLDSMMSQALLLMKGGGDVLNPVLAGTLRSIQADYSELIRIVPAKGKYSARQVHPYFGAITTPAGLRAVRAFKAARRRANSTH